MKGKDAEKKPWRVEKVKEIDRRYASNYITEIFSDDWETVYVKILDGKELIARYIIRKVQESYPPYGCSTCELEITEELYK